MRHALKFTILFLVLALSALAQINPFSATKVTDIGDQLTLMAWTYNTSQGGFVYVLVMGPLSSPADGVGVTIYLWGPSGEVKMSNAALFEDQAIINSSGAMDQKIFAYQFKIPPGHQPIRLRPTTIRRAVVNEIPLAQ